MSAFNTIKFSKEYVKLHGQRSAELLAVQRVSIPDGVSPESSWSMTRWQQTDPDTS